MQDRRTKPAQYYVRGRDGGGRVKKCILQGDAITEVGPSRHYETEDWISDDEGSYSEDDHDPDCPMILITLSKEENITIRKQFKPDTDY